jgi:hypothetical protein
MLVMLVPRLVCEKCDRVMAPEYGDYAAESGVGCVL